MLVRESISFQRGANPKKVLGIGDPKYIWNHLKQGNILKLTKDIRNFNYESGYYIIIERIISHSSREIEFVYTLYKNEDELMNKSSLKTPATSRWSITPDFFNDFFDLIK
jgi:hypothetical protein